MSHFAACSDFTTISNSPYSIKDGWCCWKRYLSSNSKKILFVLAGTNWPKLYQISLSFFFFLRIQQNFLPEDYCLLTYILLWFVFHFIFVGFYWTCIFGFISIKHTFKIFSEMIWPNLFLDPLSKSMIHHHLKYARHLWDRTYISAYSLRKKSLVSGRNNYKLFLKSGSRSSFPLAICLAQNKCT